MDLTRANNADAGRVLGKWLYKGCTVEPRFDGTWEAQIQRCQCEQPNPARIEMEIEHLTSGEALSHAAQVIEAALSGRPTSTPFGIIDPDYARIYSKARVIAWQYGYSCCAQGSFTRDLDLLLVPWIDSATRHIDAVVARIADVCELRIQGDPSQKPHGRKAWSLLLPGFSEVRWVDLSAFPPMYNDPAPGEFPKSED